MTFYGTTATAAGLDGFDAGDFMPSPIEGKGNSSLSECINLSSSRSYEDEDYDYPTGRGGEKRARTPPRNTLTHTLNRDRVAKIFVDTIKSLNYSRANLLW
jgi:hypothetical protein